jgi:hypothetical protein
MQLALDYRLTGTGWAECTVSFGELSYVGSASYLTDALGNLVRAAVAVLSGFSALSFSFQLEPGEVRWVLASPRLNELDLSIFEFPDIYAALPESNGKEVLRARLVPETFAVAVYEAACRVLSVEGESGYFKKWVEHPFPSHQVEELRGLLKGLGHAV